MTFYKPFQARSKCGRCLVFPLASVFAPGRKSREKKNIHLEITPSRFKAFSLFWVCQKSVLIFFARCTFPIFFFYGFTITTISKSDCLYSATSCLRLNIDYRGLIFCRAKLYTISNCIL